MYTKEEVLKTASQMLNGSEPPEKFKKMLDKAIAFRDRVAVLDFTVQEVAMMLAMCDADVNKEPPKQKVKKPAPPKNTDWGKVELGTLVLLASGSQAKFVKLIDKENGIAEVHVDGAELPDKIPTESLVLR